MHVLRALDKIKYTKKDEFYPAFNCRRLYHILTSKNPLTIVKPNMPKLKSTPVESSDSEEDATKMHSNNKDSTYLWNKKKHEQIKNRRRVYQKELPSNQKKQMNPNVSFILSLFCSPFHA